MDVYVHRDLAEHLWGVYDSWHIQQSEISEYYHAAAARPVEHHIQLVYSYYDISYDRYGYLEHHFGFTGCIH